MTVENTPLQNKYRPTDFSEVRGNSGVIESLMKMFDGTASRPSSFLFIGPAGCGKTTLARIIANRVGARNQDIIEVNAAEHNGVDAIRSLLDKLRYKPLGGKGRVVILDECHQITSAGQNALLKDLEEPPKDTILILCTTDPQKLLNTIKSRCTTFSMELLNSRWMKKLLKDIATKEGKPDFFPSVIDEICNKAEGHPRDALKMLDQVIRIEDEATALGTVNNFKSEETTIEELCNLIVDTTPRWSQVKELLKNYKGDPEQARRAILAWLQRRALYSNTDPYIVADLISNFSEPYFNMGMAGLVRDCINSSKPE